jgi:hypothetical protein
MDRAALWSHQNASRGRITGALSAIAGVCPAHTPVQDVPVMVVRLDTGSRRTPRLCVIRPIKRSNSTPPRHTNRLKLTLPCQPVAPRGQSFHRLWLNLTIVSSDTGPLPDMSES